MRIRTLQKLDHFTKKWVWFFFFFLMVLFYPIYFYTYARYIPFYGAVVKIEDQYYVEATLPIEKWISLKEDHLTLDQKKISYQIVERFSPVYKENEQLTYQTALLSIPLEERFKVEETILSFRLVLPKTTLWKEMISALKKGVRHD